jgi:prevent-host-death family protein
MADVTVADAKARLSELINRVEEGDKVRITRRGKPVVELTAVRQALKPVDLAALRALTDGMARETDADTVRNMRDDARY